MKNIFFILLLLCAIGNNGIAQDQNNPIDFLQGDWLLKLSKVDPTPDGEDGNMDNALVRFEAILDNRGLKQTTFNNFSEVEVYYFYDFSKSILYGNTVDANGYLWQTKMLVNADGSYAETTGGPLHDASLTVSSQLKVISPTEMTFKHIEYKNGQQVIKAEGHFHRMPRK